MDYFSQSSCFCGKEMDCAEYSCGIKASSQSPKTQREEKFDVVEGSPLKSLQFLGVGFH